MAKMIPSALPLDYPYGGERDVFLALQGDPATHDWIVLHSLEIPEHLTQVSGEMDFLVVIPGKAVIGLEVKGSRSIQRRDGVWFYGADHGGDSRGPFKQASNAVHSIRKKLISFRRDFRRIPFWSMAVFPRCNFTVAGTEWHSWQVADYSRIRDEGLPALIVNAAERARALLADKTEVGFDLDSGEPYPQQVTAMVSILRGDFEIGLGAKSVKQMLANDLKRFTADQVQLLDMLSQNERFVVTGAAGTGKTFLAMEQARRISKDGSKVLFLCFNRALADWLKEQLADLPSVAVSTFDSYMLKITKLTPSSAQDFWQLLPGKALLSLLDANDDVQFDALIVDEIQDFSGGEREDVLDLSLKGGFRAGRWYFFGDPENQKIFGSTHNSLLNQVVGKFASAPAQFSLRLNCRNTPLIGRWGEGFGKLEPGYQGFRRQDNEFEPVFEEYSSDVEQAEKLLKALNRLKSQGFTDSDIMVLSMKAEGESLIERDLVKNFGGKFRRYSLQPGVGVQHASVWTFKGLESGVVILTDLDDLDSADRYTLAYTGVTRALHHLTVLSHKRVSKHVLNAAIKRR